MTESDALSALFSHSLSLPTNSRTQGCIRHHGSLQERIAYRERDAERQPTRRSQAPRQTVQDGVAKDLCEKAEARGSSLFIILPIIITCLAMLTYLDLIQLGSRTRIHLSSSWHSRPRRVVQRNITPEGIPGQRRQRLSHSCLAIFLITSTAQLTFFTGRAIEQTTSRSRQSIPSQSSHRISFPR